MKPSSKPQDHTDWMNGANSSPPTLGYYSSAGPRVQGTELYRWKAPSRSLLWSKSLRRSLDLLQGSSSELWSPHWGAPGWTTSAPLQSKKKKGEHVTWELDEWRGLRNKDVRNAQEVFKWASGNVTKLHKKWFRQSRNVVVKCHETWLLEKPWMQQMDWILFWSRNIKLQLIPRLIRLSGWIESFCCV